MTPIKTLAAVAAVATLALAATDLSASAQSSLTNGPTTRPSRLGGAAAGHRTARRRPMTAAGRGARPASYADHRPLTVRRTVAAGPVVVAPAPGFGSGPGVIVTGPLGVASDIVSLPFRAVGGIFPATGDIATNPLVLVGAPLRAVGDIVQLPFRIIGAPFGGTGLGTY